MIPFNRRKHFQVPLIWWDFKRPIVNGTAVEYVLNMGNGSFGPGYTLSQGTGANKPTLSGSGVIFDGGDFMSCADVLDTPDKLTIEAKCALNTSVQFAGIVEKQVSGTGGYALCSSSSGTGFKPYFTTQLSKTTLNAIGTTTLTGGRMRTIKCQALFSRAWTNKQLLFNGEEPEVIKVGDTYYMYYDKYNGTTYDVYVRSSTDPLFTGSSETLLVAGAQYPCIYKDGNTYRLIVTTGTSTNFVQYSSTSPTSGFASSGTILTKGAAYDTYAIADPNLTKIGSTYYLYYSGFSAAGNATICYATSTDGATFTKQGTCLGKGGAGEFDENLTADPEFRVLPNNTYIMFYTGYNSTKAKQMQGYATSSNGTTWTKFSGNPIHYFEGKSYEVGAYGPNEPSALLDGNIWRIYYRCRNDAAASFQIGYFEFEADPNNNYLPVCGNETVTVRLYVDGVLESTTQLTGIDGIEYIPGNSEQLKVGGDGASTNYWNGIIDYIKIWTEIV